MSTEHDVISWKLQARGGRGGTVKAILVQKTEGL